MELVVRKGRPETEEGRSEAEIRTYDFLDGLGIIYESVDHEAAMTMDDCKEVEALYGDHMVKNLFLCNRQKTQYYLLIMPGEKVFKTKEISAQIKSARLSFGSAEAMVEILGVTPGSVTCMGLMNDKEHKVRFLVDRDVLEYPHMLCHPCVNTSSICLPMKDVLTTFIEATGHKAELVTLVGEDPA